MSDLKNKVVSAIQGNPVSPNRPTIGQWYIFDGTEFVPTVPAALTLGALTVSNIYGGLSGGSLNIQSNVSIITSGGSAFSVDSINGIGITVPGAEIIVTAPAGGSAATPPPNPAGYIQVMINGNPQFLPFY
jgi:hypothetical protein